MNQLIDICICTFRRPHLAKTLTSVADLTIPKGCDIRVLVVDNDDWPSAKPLVEAAQCPFKLDYIHAPARNIAVARNAGLDHAQDDFFAFLDDDETVSEEWLCALFEEMERSDADVVFGKVVSLYPAGAADWLIEGDYHSTNAPKDTRGPIKTGCSANVLMRRDVPKIRDMRFDLMLGRTGGEDTVFFRNVFEVGGAMRFAEEAIVYETVDHKRLSLGWLIQRKFRSGQSHARAELVAARVPFLQRCKLAVNASAKAGLCALLGLLFGLDRSRRNFWIIRGALHVGVVSKCLGFSEPVLYGQAQTPRSANRI